MSETTSLLGISTSISASANRKSTSAKVGLFLRSACQHALTSELKLGGASYRLETTKCVYKPLEEVAFHYLYKQLRKILQTLHTTASAISLNKRTWENGSCPVQISHKIKPNAYTSRLLSNSSWFSTSGAIHRRVPFGPYVSSLSESGSSKG